jgi:hypothetical protein
MAMAPERTILLHCGDCEQDKPAAAFPKNRARSTGRGFYCKPCHSARVQAWKRANPEKAGRKAVAP